MTNTGIPTYTGKYFAILDGDPVILTIEETYSQIAYDDGGTDPLFYHDEHDIVWVAIEDLFNQETEIETTS